MGFEKIPVKTLRQQVYDQLRSKIISADIFPGQVMTLQGLAKELGVSVMPVREALWQLESEKVIVIESNKRIHVNALKKKEMEEMLGLRLVLESRAASAACERVTAGELAGIKHLLDSMEAALDKPKEYVALNTQFHFSIYSCADMPTLFRMIDSLWARVAPYINIAWDKAGDHALVMMCHRGMYEALNGRDKETLSEWLRRDLTEAASVIVPFLEDPDDKTKGSAGAAAK